MRSMTVPTVKPKLSLQVSRATADRVAAAAKAADQPVAAWLRIAIIEKLERDRG